MLQICTLLYMYSAQNNGGTSANLQSIRVYDRATIPVHSCVHIELHVQISSCLFESGTFVITCGYDHNYDNI